ncbi:NAD(P)H-dependent flavin oxidoreductase [Chitinophaga arvensicola]|uniref:Nitronate monooxygenase n=1 Tax=Chitinophaga arvensicola TaxID=29529 RepID=A0A1I0S601_9BACT|nr:nitronate monooxygenase family protein [Chitinophaga arvensicola]SEW50727.1 nitronate monooxygenase [Chitinophaga arvensicola]
MEWKNELTRMLGITYPIIQAPMLGITTPAMVAAVSNSGGLGSLPVGGLPPEKITALIREVKALTQQPFAVNLFVYEPAAHYDRKTFDDMQEFLQFLYGAHQLAATPVSYDEVPFYSWRVQLPVILAAGIRHISFTFGMPDEEGFRLLKEHQALLMGTATCIEEASLLVAAGTDVVVVQGIEAGGHRGSFLPGELPRIGTMALVPQVVDRVRVPVIAAGGIMDGRGVAAARMLGASGVQVGSLFLRAEESLATPAHKAVLAGITDTDTLLTRAFSGRWARGVRNTLLKEIEASGLPISDYPYQDALTQPIRKVARELDKTEFINVWAGQAAGKARAWSTGDIFAELVRETTLALSK